MKKFLYVIEDNYESVGIIEATDWQDALMQLFVWDSGTNNVVEKSIRAMDKFEDAKVIFDKFTDGVCIIYFGEVTEYFINNLDVIELDQE